MKKILALVTAVAAWGAVNSYGQGNKWNLKQCIDTGIARNLDVLQGDLAVQTADANLKMAKASRFPYLNASLGQGINQGRSIDPFTNGYINQSVTYGSYGLNSGVTLLATSATAVGKVLQLQYIQIVNGLQTSTRSNHSRDKQPISC